ncbi:ribosome biogenesis GTPase Der [Patescibacteria group bacterium]|nr:ribosome biogenesis GTPase Der [Patescibacteria group bacterium]
MKDSKIVLIGRTNVGKSTLFNKLIEKKKSIVSSESNTTRDIIEGNIIWRGLNFNILDTGGIDIDGKVQEEAEILKQAYKFVKKASLVFFVVDAKAGLMPYDEEISQKIRKLNKKVVLVINKSEVLRNRKEILLEFSKLGIPKENTFLVSAASGMGTGELLDYAHGNISSSKIKDNNYDIRISIIGKPNVGKSSLLNAILNDDRSIVADRPHTTRESIDADFTYKDKKFLIIDTAGIRKKRNIKSKVEMISVSQSLYSIKNSDVVLFVIDVASEITSQDKKLISIIKEHKKGLIFIINKWDLIEDKNSDTINRYKKYIEDNFIGTLWAPILFVSAKEKLRISKILDNVISVYENLNRVVDGNLLEDILRETIKKQKPNKNRKFKPLRLKHLRQDATYPPTFSVLIPKKDILLDSYKNYISKEIRKNFDFSGTQIIVRTRHSSNLED